MASAATTVLRLEKAEQGITTEWGTKLNTALDMLDSAIAGTEAISTTGGTTTLTNVNFTNDQAKKRVLYVTGTLVSNATIVIPNTSRLYKVINGTSGAFTVTVNTGAGGKVVTQGTAADLYCDGSNNILFTGCLTVTGTGAPNSASGAVASSVAVTPVGNLTSTDAQAGLAELQTDIDTINSTLTSSYQPLDSDLTTIAGLAKTKGNLIVGNGSAWAAEAIGTNGFALIAKSGATNGTVWAALIPAATVMLFYSAAAPTGWTVSNADSDKAIRIVSGTSGLGGAAVTGAGALSGSFASIFASRTILQANLPSYTLPNTLGVTVNPATGFVRSNQVTIQNGTGQNVQDNVGNTAVSGTVTGSVTSGGSGTAMDFAVSYISVIKAAKDAY